MIVRRSRSAARLPGGPRGCRPRWQNGALIGRGRANGLAGGGVGAGHARQASRPRRRLGIIGNAAGKGHDHAFGRGVGADRLARGRARAGDGGEVNGAADGMDRA
jgi:hypothetical protein